MKGPRYRSRTLGRKFQDGLDQQLRVGFHPDPRPARSNRIRNSVPQSKTKASATNAEAAKNSLPSACTRAPCSSLHNQAPPASRFSLIKEASEFVFRKEGDGSCQVRGFKGKLPSDWFLLICKCFAIDMPLAHSVEVAL